MGRATTGPNVTVPMSDNAAPKPMGPARFASTPLSTSPTPSTVITVPITSRSRLVWEVSTADSRRAARGETREARTAGMTAPIMVMMTPTVIPTTAVLAWNTSPPGGNGNPATPNRPIHAAPTSAAYPTRGCCQAGVRLAGAGRRPERPGMAAPQAQADARRRDTADRHFAAEGVHKEHSPACHWMVARAVTAIVRANLVDDAW